MASLPILRRRTTRSGKQTPFKIERPEYYVQTGSMFENPYGVPHEEIVRMILENPAEVSAQVVFGKYVESSGLVFTGEVIQMLFDRTLERILGSTWMNNKAASQAQQMWRRNPGRSNNRFYTGVDLARQTDYTVIFTIDTIFKPAHLVYYRRLNRVPWESIYAEIGKAVYLFGQNVLFDGTGPGGDVVGDALESRVYCATHHKTSLLDNPGCVRGGNRLDCKPEQYQRLSCAEPFHFTGTTKKELVEHLRNVLSVGYDAGNPDHPFGWLRSPPIPQLEEEMAFYAWDDKKLVTDCLFALALAVWAGLEDPISDVSVGSPFGT